MCKISKKTVIRANRLMIGSKSPKRIDKFDSLRNEIKVSVFANGKMYKQTLTEKQMQDAFHKALIKHIAQ